MAVFRIEKQKNYTVMSNYHLQDRTLSYKAKGLLSFMLSLPEDWDYSMKGLVTVSKENIKAIRSILNELKEHGYLEIQQTRGEKGYYKYEYIIREIPLDVLQEKNNPDTQKGYTDTGDSEKEQQINTNKQNPKEQIVKDVKSNFPFVDLEELNPLTHRLINNIVDYEFMDEQGNKIENKYGFFKGAMDNCFTRLKVNEELEIDPETGWFKEDNEEEIDLFDRDY